MKAVSQKSGLRRLKQWVFEYVFIIDEHRFRNKYLLLLLGVLQLTALHYYYIHPHYQILTPLSYFQIYLKSIYPYFMHIIPFHNPMFALLTLSVIPILSLLLLVVKQIGPNRLLIMAVALLTYIFPLLLIKMVQEIIDLCRNGNYVLLAVPLGSFSLVFGGFILAIMGKLHRLLELPLVLLLQFGANQYAILVILSLRLAVLFYLKLWRSNQALGIFFQTSLFIILLSCYVCDDQSLNYIGFAVVLFSFLIFGSNQIYKSFSTSKDIYDYADELEQDEELAQFEVSRLVEEHYLRCAHPECKCHTYWDLPKEKLKDWIYEFEEERLKKRDAFEDRVEYAAKCCDKYEYKLNGMLRMCEFRPKNLIQEYTVFRVCLLFQINLRRQDKNYRYGQAYLNVHEQVQLFSLRMLQILQMVKQFWGLITNFDGSIKFLSSILQISALISLLRADYQNYQRKYDDELKEFKYIFDLFQTIILNESIIEEDELVVPEPITFMISNEQHIIAVNNNCAALLSSTPQLLVGKSFLSFVPEVYRDVHKQWTRQFVEIVNEYEGKYLQKCLSVGVIQIKMVEMQHKILPRFLQGLEIFTLIKTSVPNKRSPKDSFTFLVEKDTYYIKNVEASFFDIINFKVNQRNFKILQEVSLTSIFDNFTHLLIDNPTRQVTIFSHFLDEFTYGKKKKDKKKESQKKVEKNEKTDRSERPDKNQKAKSRASALKNAVSFSKAKPSTNEQQQIFEYQILPNVRQQDPYIKVQFHLKDNRAEDTNESMSEISGVQQERSSEEKEKEKDEQIKYHNAYYMLLVFGVAHIMFILSRNVLDSTFESLSNKYYFYLAYDYTTLNVLGAYIGRNQIDQLRNLWIQGYGEFSESFNAFQRITDPYFMTYFNDKITIQFHNQLFENIENGLNSNLNMLEIYRVVVLFLMIAALGHCILDLILSLRYIFKIQAKVGELLLQFVVVDQADVAEIIQVIDNFSSNVLNAQQNVPQPFKVPIETVQQSALELMKGGVYSLNNSLNLQAEPDTEAAILQRKAFHYARRSSAFDDRQRVSLSIMKQQFKQTRRSAFGQHEHEDTQTDKSRNISLFRQKYASCGFILSANKKLFLMLFVSVLLACSAFTSGILVLNPPMLEFSKHIWVLQDLFQAKILFLKSVQQIAVGQYNLEPTFTINQMFLINQQQIKTLSGSSIISDFQNEFDQFLTDNQCNRLSTYNCSHIKQMTALPDYGFSVLNQYIEQYFRKRNATALKVKNNQNELIEYMQLLLDVLIADFRTASSSYLKQIDLLQLNLVIIGTVLVLISMFLNHTALKQFKNRIEDSNNLLKIIPKEIQAKHSHELEVYMMREVTL